MYWENIIIKPNNEDTVPIFQDNFGMALHLGIYIGVLALIVLVLLIIINKFRKKSCKGFYIAVAVVVILTILLLIIHNIRINMMPIY